MGRRPSSVYTAPYRAGTPEETTRAAAGALSAEDHPASQDISQAEQEPGDRIEQSCKKLCDKLDQSFQRLMDEFDRLGEKMGRLGKMMDAQTRMLACILLITFILLLKIFSSS